MAESELMTTAQVLEFLQIGRTKLWGLVRTGSIAAYRIGDGPNGSLRYRHKEIVDWLEEAFPQRLFINPMDARNRGIRDGMEVRVFNDRGATRIPCRVTERIMPGVVALPEGAWWSPDKDGTDRRGSINVLTSERWTPLAFGNAHHTAMVQVEKI